MTDSASSPATLQTTPQHSESLAPNSHHNQSDPSPVSTSSSSAPVAVNPNSKPDVGLAAPPPPPPPPPPPAPPSHPTISYAVAPPQVAGGAAFVPPAVPSFRPLPPQAPQFSPLPNPGSAPNPNYQNHSVRPPGVTSAPAMTPGVASGSGAVPVSVPQMQPMMSYQVPPGQPAHPALRPYTPMPNGYAAVPAAPQGTIPPAVS